MNLKQELALASKTPDAEISFDEVLAKRLFLKALEQDYLAMQLYLKQTHIP